MLPEIFNHADLLFHEVVRRAYSNSTNTNTEREYFAKLNLFTGMAHYVGKELNIRPNAILDEWGISELCVAYGYYSNQVTKQEYDMWRSQDVKSRGKMPDKYNVRFVE